MSEIRFEVHEETLELLNPTTGFQPERQRVQVRKDPLLGHTSVYNPALRDKAGILFGDIDREWLGRLVAQSAERCIFCPERIMTMPKYPRSLLAEGRLRMGEATLFPNLFSLAKHHAVVVVSEAHYLELHEFTLERIGNALLAMQQFMQAAYRLDGEAGYATLTANYLFPAGASMVHPHFHLLIGSRPYAHQAALLAAWRDYQAGQGSLYGADLVTSELRLGERYIGQRGGWHWLAAYAPLGNNEIQALHDRAGDFTELPTEEIRALADGLSRLLRVYEGLGYLSFNFALYSQPRAATGARLFLRLVTRQNPAPGYRCDDYFLQKLLQTELILLPPEDLAQQARPFFT
jgi:galactose-1-phosphate uridylyltransferase